MKLLDTGPKPLGDSCLLWSFRDSISHEINRGVLTLYRILKEDFINNESGILDIVPAYSSLAIHFDPSIIDSKSVEKMVNKTISSLDGPSASRFLPAHYIIPVLYDGVDLEPLANQKGLTPREVIDAHTNPQYSVALIGFLPHFPYLLGMDPCLATPRLSRPRTKVPAGSVGIGGAQTGVYPRDSPGGWHLIGRADPYILKFLRAGDRVVFEEVDNL